MPLTAPTLTETCVATPEALRWGMAAGAAALLVPGTALARATDVHRLQSQVIVRALPA